MKQFKKVLAFVLALAMVVTAVPTADAKAAAKAPKLNNTKKILYVGQSYTLKIGNLPANWKKCTYAWSASNKNVTVKKGKYGQAASVKANKAGTATVTVKMTYPQTAAQKKAKKKTVKTFKCVVTVKNPSVKFTTTADRIEVGETAQFTAKATPSTAKVTYSSSDAAVATVDATGLVTAVADGTATIKASAKVGTKTVTASKSVEVYTAPTEAKQTKVKEITITSGKVVTKESKIAVKKGSVEVALAEKDGIAIDATGKTVVLTTAAKLTKGEYTVTIDDATANFTAEDEKVTDIEFTSDKAVLDKATDNGAGKNIYKTAKVAYKVYNQFKEDITDSTNVTVSGNGVALTNDKGVVEFTSQATDGFRLNDIVAAVVIYNENGVAVTKSGTFTVTNEAAISEITIKDGVYTKKGEAVTFTEDNDLKDAYVLVSAKDQYGRAVTTLDWTKNQENVYVQIAGGLTYLKDADTESVEITVDGVKYAGIKLTKEADKELGAGTATILVVSKGTGVTAQGTITVANGSKVDTLTIQVPNLVPGGETTKLGYTALDSYGKEVTSASALSKVTGIGTIPRTGEIYVKENPVTEKAELYYVAADNKKTVNDLDVESLVTPTYKTSTVQISISPNAQPTAITGTKDLTTGALAGESITVTEDNIKVVDQYGRAIGLYNKPTYKNNTNAGEAVTIFAEIKTDDQKVFATANNVTGVEVNKNTDDDGSDDAKITAATTDESTLAETSEAKVRFYLTTAAQFKAGNDGEDTTSIYTSGATPKYNQNLVLSTYDVTFSAVKYGDIKTFEVADITPVYCGKDTVTNAKSSAGTDLAAYDKSFDVKGVTADGTKVNIPETSTGNSSSVNYVVSTASKDTNVVAVLTETKGKIKAANLVGTDDAKKALYDKDSIEESITFTIGGSLTSICGQEIEKKVTLTKAKPQVKEVKIKNDKEAVAKTSITTDAYTTIQAQIEAKDQYGVDIAAVAFAKPRVTISNIKDKDNGAATKLAVTDNGQDGASLDNWATGDSVLLKLTFDGGFVFTTKFVNDTL